MPKVARIWKEHRVKWGKRAGTIELREPYRYGDGFYRVADLSVGQGHNTDANAIKVATLDEVAGYIRKGYGVRMRSGVGKASLNCADNIQIEYA
ncbi:MAG: hypothetical protein ACTHN4_01220 [Sphingomicrobium sp.]